MKFDAISIPFRWHFDAISITFRCIYVTHADKIVQFDCISIQFRWHFDLCSFDSFHRQNSRIRWNSMLFRYHFDDISTPFRLHFDAYMLNIRTKLSNSAAFRFSFDDISTYAVSTHFIYKTVEFDEIRCHFDTILMTFRLHFDYISMHIC